MWWGFSASTGGSYNVHTVCLYENVSPSGDIAICPGFTTQLIAGGDINSEYSWSPIDYLDDPTVYNPDSGQAVATTEKAKIELSSTTSTEINLPYIMP